MTDEPFDPEKVQRLHVLGMIVVDASDYDKLLTMYRELDVALANAKFLQTSGDALINGQAEEIERLTAKLAQKEQNGD